MWLDVIEPLPLGKLVKKYLPSWLEKLCNDLAANLAPTCRNEKVFLENSERVYVYTKVSFLSLRYKSFLSFGLLS